MSERHTNETREPVAKVVRDGKVAVLVSPNFGAGWSTWSDYPDRAAFAPDVVAWVEAGKVGDTEPFERYELHGRAAERGDRVGSGREPLRDRRVRRQREAARPRP